MAGIFLFGANELALEVLTELENYSNGSLWYQIVVDAGFVPAQDFPAEVKIYTGTTVFDQYTFINCIGYKNLKSRKAVSERLKLIAPVNSYISNDAYVSNKAKIEDGALILAGAWVERGAHIGEGSIVWGGARVCHDAKIMPYSFLASGVRIGGGAYVGSYCKLGFNSVVEDGARVPEGFSLHSLKFFKRNGAVF